MKTLILNILMMLLLTSCLPDSLEKWEMDQPQELTGCSNISIQGQTICAEAATSELFAAGFSYPAIESNEDKLTLPTVVELSSINPEFIGEPEGATYFFTSVKSSAPETWFDFSEYGLTLNRDTGEITGTPTKFLPRTDVIIKAYHVQSGQWFSYEFNMAIATNFDVEGRTLSYPFPDTISYERLRLSVTDASIFSTCSEQTCFTTTNGVKGYIDHIDLERNLLFVKVKNTDRAGKDWEKEVISVGENIENGNDFIASSSTIDEVVRTVDLSNSSHKEYTPYFNFGLDTESEEWKDLRWSISPLPPGGIQDGRQGTEEFHLVYKDDATPGNMGVLYWEGQSDPEKPQEYTISVKNSIGQILQTKVMLNFERPPEGLGVSNFALIQVNQYDKIYVGDYISTTEEDLAKVYHKTYVSYDDADEEEQYKYYLMVKLLKGDFTDKEEIDHFKTFSRSVASIIGETQLVNNVLTVNETSFGSLGDDGEISDSDKKYVAYEAENGSTATLKLAATSLQTIEVVNPYQFSVGLQVVDEEDNSGVVMGIYTSMTTAPSSETTYVIIQPTKKRLANGKKIQLGRSTFDQTEESTDYIISSSSQELKNIFILASGNKPAMIDQLYNVTDPLAKKISQNKEYSSSSDATQANIISLWSPVIKLWSKKTSTADPSIDETYKFTPGSDVYTYSRLTGVVNKRDKEENSIYIEMDQFGFLPHKEHTDADTTRDTQRPYYFTFSEYHQDKINLATDQENQILENDMNKDVNDDGNDETKDGDTPIQLGMSPTFVVYRGENINIKSQTHYGGNMDYFLEPSPETLPAGITYDSTTGTFSGIPEEKMAARKYTITARNPLGSTSYDFYLQVKDRMFIENITISDSDYMLHKMGQSRQHADCQITEEQIKNFQLDERDILCTLDVPENDLRNSAVSLNLNIGSNICEYTDFSPYSFNYLNSNHVYKKSGTSGILPDWLLTASDELTRVQNALNTDAGLVDLPQLVLATDDSPTQPYYKVFREYSKPEGCNQCWHPELQMFIACDLLVSDPVKCDGDHSSKDGPNCDDGKYIVRKITIGEDIDPNSEDEEGVEDGFCGGSNGFTKTYTEAFIDRSDATSFDETNEGDYTLTISTSHQLDAATSIPAAPLYKLGVYALDTDKNLKIDADDDITEDGVPEYFIFFQGIDLDEDTNPNNDRIIHLKSFYTDPASGSCRTFTDAKNAVNITTGGENLANYDLLKNFKDTASGELSNYGADYDTVVLRTLPNSNPSSKTRFLVDFSHSSGTPAAVTHHLIKQVDSLAYWDNAGSSIIDATYDPANKFQTHHYFLFDSNCDGESDKAVTFKTLFDQFGSPGFSENIVSTGVNDGSVSFSSGEIFNIIRNSSGKILGVDTTPDGYHNDKNADEKYISTATTTTSSPWSEQEDPESPSECGGNYSSCLMGQAKDFLSEEDIEVNIGGFYYSSISNFSQDFEFKNTDPTQPHTVHTSWDIANYMSQNSCSFSPNLFFEESNELFDNDNSNLPDADQLAFAGVKYRTMQTFNENGNLLEEFLPNESDPFDDYAQNIDYLTDVIGLGDIAARAIEYSNIDDVEIPIMEINTFVDNDTSFDQDKIGGNGFHTTSYEITPTNDNSTVKVDHVSYRKSVDSLAADITNIKKINYFDQEVKNWANINKKVYIKIYMGTAATLSDEDKRAIGLELITDGMPFNEIKVRLEGYESHLAPGLGHTDPDYLIISVDKSDAENLIQGMITNDLDFNIETNRGSGAGNTTNDLVFATTAGTIKYLPEIITTPFSSAHDFTPSPFYRFNCLDEAFDIKARITLQIREWDRNFTNGVDLDKTIPSARMDNNSHDLFDDQYNDYPDLDDALVITDELINEPTGSYEGCFIKTPTLWNVDKGPGAGAPNFHNIFD